MPVRTVSALCSLIHIVSLASAHMEMSWPYPLRSRYNPQNSYSNIDYSMTSPLSADGSNFPCKGYQNDRPIQPTANYAAGSSYNITLAGTATHNGGSCQISLSYDNGATFKVIKSMIGGCPLSPTYSFTIPPYVPSGDALLAWTWQNNEGNREFYMNCAEVSIVSPASRRRKRQTFSTFESLPFIWKANLDGINDCVTTEGSDPVYPNPGPDVAYANGASSSSSLSPGTCDSPGPFGQTYRDLGGGTSSNEPVNSYTAATQANEGPFLAATTGTYMNLTTPIVLHSTPPPHQRNGGYTSGLLVPYQNSSTTTVTIGIDCEATTTITLPPHTHYVSSTHTVRPTSPSTPSTSHPHFANGDLSQYLPCVPGTFICTSSTTWWTCDQNDGSGQTSEPWMYLYPRQVAAGMECLPHLSSYTSQTGQYGQQPGVPNGSYRDDQIVRARPDGDCEPDGSLQCTDGGQGFEICDQGGWVRMGSVAPGTICMNGEIIAA